MNFNAYVVYLNILYFNLHVGSGEENINTGQDIGDSNQVLPECRTIVRPLR
jgi:hypothetical protein